jgi:hypothetical protein
MAGFWKMLVSSFRLSTKTIEACGFKWAIFSNGCRPPEKMSTGLEKGSFTSTLTAGPDKILIASAKT